MTLIPIIEKTQICFVHCGKEVCKCNPSKSINKMKQIEFKTEKGEFLVVDVGMMSNDEREQMFVNSLNNFNGICLGDNLFEEICKLSEAREENAKGVVDDRLVFQSIFIKDMITCYTNYNNNNEVFKSTLDSLHSILTSKCIDINNGNWYLFKKV